MGTRQACTEKAVVKVMNEVTLLKGSVSIFLIADLN